MRAKGWAALGAAVLGLLVLALPVLVLAGGAPAASETPGQTSPTAAPSPAVSAPSAAVSPAPADGRPYCAVWVSYLEWQQVDFSSAERFAADAGAMLDDIAGLGATVVLAHVRPFGDALYESALFPWSHLATGTQGRDPGFDPLAILVDAAHARGLELEAWVNPYRLQAGGAPELAGTGLAARHPDWVREAAGGLYLNPADPDVRAYIADGVAELCAGYAIDGVHFDDYFYPTTDPDFDAAEYAAYCAETADPLGLDDWRRANVDALVALCCETAHQYGVRFGIAPQGDPDQNRATQYSDAARWLAEGGYVDYLMPQLYWGLDYTRDGDDAHSLCALAGRWLAMPRRDEVALYFGLGAYRIGEGDGGDRTGPGTEWQRGDALAAQAEALAAMGGQGVGLYRYDSLFRNTLYPTLAAEEVEALRGMFLLS